jgi:hypothetical protein
VGFVGVDKLHAAFLDESRTRGRVQCSVQEIRVIACLLSLPRESFRGRGTVTSMLFRMGQDVLRRQRPDRGRRIFKLSRLPTIKRTHSAYPCSLRNISSLCGPREAKQCRAEITWFCLAMNYSELGLSVSWLRGTELGFGAKPDRTAAAKRTRNRNRYCYSTPVFGARPEAVFSNAR